MFGRAPPAPDSPKPSRFNFCSQTLLDPAAPSWICSTKMVDLPLDSPNLWSTPRGALPNPTLVELKKITHHATKSNFGGVEENYSLCH